MGNGNEKEREVWGWITPAFYPTLTNKINVNEDQSKLTQFFNVHEDYS